MEAPCSCTVSVLADVGQQSEQDESNGCRVTSVAACAAAAAATTAGGIAAAAWSPDGELLAVLGYNQLLLLMTKVRS